MEDVRKKDVPPSVSATAFNCPHCGVLTTQFWLSAHADRLKKGATPFVPNEEVLNTAKFDVIEDPEERERTKRWLEGMVAGRPFLRHEQKYRDYNASNIWFSECYDCHQIAIWIHDRLIWPRVGNAPLPNPDFPAEVREDYDEAGVILDASPRGAAALLRLAIQKLCKHLGEPGKNITTTLPL